MKQTFFLLLTILILASTACRFTASDSTPAPDSVSSTLPAPKVDSLPTTVPYKTIAGIDPDLLSLDIHAPGGACPGAGGQEDRSKEGAQACESIEHGHSLIFRASASNVSNHMPSSKARSFQPGSRRSSR